MCIHLEILHSQTGHLVHVAVTIFDSNGRPVINLGLVNPWMCEASLVLSKGQKQRYIVMFACIPSMQIDTSQSPAWWCNKSTICAWSG